VQQLIGVQTAFHERFHAALAGQRGSNRCGLVAVGRGDEFVCVDIEAGAPRQRSNLFLVADEDRNDQPGIRARDHALERKAIAWMHHGGTDRLKAAAALDERSMMRPWFRNVHRLAKRRNVLSVMLAYPNRAAQVMNEPGRFPQVRLPSLPRIGRILSYSRDVNSDRSSTFALLLALATQTISQTVTANGSTTPQDTVLVGSQDSGTIAELLVDYNSPVHVGRVLARLDPSTFVAALDQAKANLAQLAAQGGAAVANESSALVLAPS
jgi:hypothetical protein